MAGDSDKRVEEQASDSGTIFVKVALGVFVMLICMIISANFTGPSGQKLGVDGFILFWFRELALLLFLFVVVAFALLRRLWRRSKKSSESKNAP